MPPKQNSFLPELQTLPRVFVILTLCVCSNSLYAAPLSITDTSALPITSLPKTNAVPGGIAIVDLELTSDKTNDKTPIVFYQKKRVMVADKNGRWLGIVGLGLTTKPGQHELQIKGFSKPVSFTVNPKKYAEQHITIKDKRKVNPNAEDMKRIRRERVRINSALKHWADSSDLNTRFVLPVVGQLSSPFGLRRFFNEQARKPHSGIDIAAPEGTLIQSPAAGKVIESGDFFFNGNSVFIDHGQGLVTMYCHMSNIKVKPGQMVAQGETIGAVGQTGRVTGPHLHWSVSLNNARVDPNLFFDNLSRLFKINIK
jgi:murein DD-endopeptidase MepM/ murein hydrolase activator NlpD